MKKRLLLNLFLIILITAAAIWIVHPQGSKINLKPLKINYFQELKIRLGLDLQGGSHLQYQADFSQVSTSDRAEALDSIRDIIERRVNSFGVAEPQITVSGLDKISIELPGIKNIQEAIDQIGQTPTLEFKLENKAVKTEAQPDGTVKVVGGEEPWLPVGLSGKQLQKAVADIDQSQGLGGEVVVRLTFNDEGKKLFGEITSKNIDSRLAIFLDGELISAPVIRAAITDGVAIISGDFNSQTAKDLARRLNSGALPVPIKLVSQQNVGATLGQESVNKSIIAGLIGLIMIALFMLVNYRLPGLLAVVALLIYTLVSLAIFKVGISLTAVILVGICFFLSLTVSGWFGALGIASYIALMFLNALSPVTLTLAGIAGFILSIGMAVDANILIFERLKEEIRAGKDVAKATEDGFKRAWLSIRDSNVSSLITTLILYYFGTPAIKGFAVTLSIGIIVSMFTAITITRTFIKLFLTNKLLSHPTLFGVSKTSK